ncbi:MULTISPECIES: hypothetical protein [Staphylococcus]|uniref:Uncharacterized protein n=1 Tax=Staphylococcus aureus TaxID=1280 RepID=A0AAE3D5A3_STAAU|nr:MULTISPECIES: hypothetical protein [Staphylococcus]HDH6200930.1 hypothetical protein [Staphylococcus aureus LTCF-15-62]HDH6208320.1 hypothetical protein [Staphylococcus aureus LTCF-14-59]HDH6281331.1 hypothetical protein [Staphylococcus aureus LTCF-3-23]HDH6492957.1 hypothetical protein [Staphylococcus aureus MRSA-Lux-7]HDK8312492.1 hypothetical protein [Staphylococcus aureus subsp. aureus ST22]
MLFNKVLSRILTYKLNFSNSHQKDKTLQSTNLTRKNKK